MVPGVGKPAGPKLSPPELGVGDGGGALYYASAELQADKEVVLAAVKRDGMALRCVLTILL